MRIKNSKCIICGKELPIKRYTTCSKQCCKDYQRRYQSALYELRRKHEEEFKQLLKEIK